MVRQHNKKSGGSDEDGPNDENSSPELTESSLVNSVTFGSEGGCEVLNHSINFH